MSFGDDDDFMQSISEARSQLAMLESTVKPITQLAQSSQYRLQKLSPRPSTQVIDEIRRVVVPEREQQLAYIRELEDEVETQHGALLGCQRENAILRDQVNQISKMNLTNQQKLQHTEQLQGQLDLLLDFKQNLADKNRQAQIELKNAQDAAFERIKQAETRCAAAEAEKRELEDTITNLKAQLAQRDSQRAQLHYQREQSETQARDLEVQCAEARGNAENAEQRVQQLQTQLARQQAANDNYDRNLATLSAQLAQQREEHSTLNSRLQQSQKAELATKEQVSVLSDQIEQMRQQMKDAGALSDRNKELVQENKTLAQMHKTALQELSDRSAELERLKQQVQRHEEQSRVLGEDIARRGLEAQQLRQQLSRLLDQAQTLQTQASALKQENDVLAQAAQRKQCEAADKISQLERDRVQLDSEVSALRAEASTLRENDSALRDENQALEAANRALEAENGQLTAKLQHFEAGAVQNERLAAECRELRENAFAQAEEIRSLQDSVSASNGQNRALSARITQLEDENAVLKTDNAALRQSAESAHQKSDQTVQMRELIQQQNAKLKEIAGINATLLGENKQLAQMLQTAEKSTADARQAMSENTAMQQQTALQIAAQARRFAHALRMMQMDVGAAAANAADAAGACSSDEWSREQENGDSNGQAGQQYGQNGEIDASQHMRTTQKIPVNAAEFAEFLKEQLNAQRCAVDAFVQAAGACRKRAEAAEASLARERALSAALQERQLRAQKEQNQLTEQLEFYQQAKDATAKQHRQLVASLQAQIDHLRRRGASPSAFSSASPRGPADTSPRPLSGRTNEVLSTKCAESCEKSHGETALLARQIRELQAQNDALARRADAALVPALNTRILELETSQQNAEKNTRTLTQQLDLVRVELGAKQEESAQFKARAMQLQRRIDALTAENAAFSSQAAEQNGTRVNAALAAENEQLRNSLQTAQRQLIEAIQQPQ